MMLPPSSSKLLSQNQVRGSSGRADGNGVSGVRSSQRRGASSLSVGQSESRPNCSGRGGSDSVGVFDLIDDSDNDEGDGCADLGAMRTEQGDESPKQTRR